MTDGRAVDPGYPETSTSSVRVEPSWSVPCISNDSTGGAGRNHADFASWRMRKRCVTERQGYEMTDVKVHPDLRRVAKLVPRHAVGPRSLRTIRTAQSLLGRLQRSSGVQVVPVGATSVRLFLPSGSSTDLAMPAVLWIHGGGYVIGEAAQDDRICRELAERLGAVVASVDYRLAPEHPFPTPLDDCESALRWLAARPDVDPTRVAVSGASAGGGLAAALAQRVRDRGEVALAFQSLVYPMLDDRTVLRTGIDERSFRLWDQRSNRFGWASYLGVEPGSDAIPPGSVPARCADLAGLAPAWIGIGTLDLFFEEDTAYAERLRTSGVPCELDVVDGAFHGFDSVLPKAGVSRALRTSQIAALAAAFAR